MVQRREEILDYLRSRKSELYERYHIRKIALIGSFARGEHTEHSDIDLLVDIEENTPHLYETKKELKKEFERQFGRRVEVASERYLKPYYRQQILKEAIYVS